MLRDSVVVVLRTRPRAIPLAMITIRKSFMGFLFFPVMTMGLRLAALWAAGAPLKSYTRLYPLWHIRQVCLSHGLYFRDPKWNQNTHGKTHDIVAILGQ